MEDDARPRAVDLAIAEPLAAVEALYNACWVADATVGAGKLGRGAADQLHIFVVVIGLVETELSSERWDTSDENWSHAWRFEEEGSYS